MIIGGNLEFIIFWKWIIFEVLVILFKKKWLVILVLFMNFKIVYI